MALVNIFTLLVLVGVGDMGSLVEVRASHAELKEVHANFMELKQGNCFGSTLVVDSSGTTITSPGYPEVNYDNNELCTWNITAQDPNHTLELQCDDFQLRQSCNCRGDRLVIFEDGVRQAKFCGSGAKSYNSSGNQMEVKFITNSRRRDKGFSCLIRSVETSPNCVCGIANTNRISGGQEVSPRNKFPWHVGIREGSQSYYRLGGSIINERYVLTLADAFVGRPASDFSVAVGEHIMLNTTDFVSGVTELVAVDNITVHPNFSVPFINNIALLRLAAPLDLSKEELGAVCLPEDDSNTYENQTAIATGWDSLSYGIYSGTLLEAFVTIQSCSHPTTPDNTLLCAEGPGRGPCSGDWGGPLVVQEDSHYVQVGATLTFVCENFGQHWFTRVSKVIEWIKENTADATYCSFTPPGR